MLFRDIKNKALDQAIDKLSDEDVKSTSGGLTTRQIQLKNKLKSKKI